MAEPVIPRSCFRAGQVVLRGHTETSAGQGEFDNFEECRAVRADLGSLKHDYESGERKSGGPVGIKADPRPGCDDDHRLSRVAHSNRQRVWLSHSYPLALPQRLV